MSNIKKLMEAVELVLNEEDEAADKKLHEYFVGLARKINEELEDAELSEADFDMDREEDLTDEISSDMDEIEAEEGVLEDDDEMNMDMDDEMDDMSMDMDMDDEDAMDDLEGGDDDIDGLFQELQNDLDELRAKFDSMSDEESEEGEFGDEEELDLDGEEDEGEFSFGDEEDEGFEDEGEVEESLELDEDEDCDDDDDDLDESVELSKVSAPTNSEGHEVGKGGSFTPNTKQNLKPQGNLKSSNTKGVMSNGGEAKGHKPLNQQGGAKAKDMGNPDNTVSSAKSSQSKVPAEGKGDKEAGKGGSVKRNKDSLIKKKVR